MINTEELITQSPDGEAIVFKGFGGYDDFNISLKLRADKGRAIRQIATKCSHTLEAINNHSITREGSYKLLSNMGLEEAGRYARSNNMVILRIRTEVFYYTLGSIAYLFKPSTYDALQSLIPSALLPGIWGQRDAYLLVSSKAWDKYHSILQSLLYTIKRKRRVDGKVVTEVEWAGYARGLIGEAINRLGDIDLNVFKVKVPDGINMTRLVAKADTRKFNYVPSM